MIRIIIFFFQNTLLIFFEEKNNRIFFNNFITELFSYLYISYIKLHIFKLIDLIN